MKKQKNRKGIGESLRDVYYNAPQVWYRCLGIAAALLIWLLLCLAVFVWSENRMKKENIKNCEEAHGILDAVENLCKEQVKDIYKASGLLGDFWLFWNYDMEGYMERRLLESGDKGEVESFPEYMNVFLTEHKNIFNKIYFITINEIYSLQAAKGGGGGVYHYDISREQYIEECTSGANGYPISVIVQDIYDKKTNVGEIIFLVNGSYLFGGLKTPYNQYVTLEHGDIRKSWGESEGVKFQDFGKYWTIYECRSHENKIEIGFQISDILWKYWSIFLTVTGAVIFAVGLMLVWLGRIVKSNEEFLAQFIHTIQLAKEEKFQQIEIGKRKDNYAMLAREINDMIVSLDLHIKKEYLLKISQQKTEMKVMLYQINPHFLYNTLEIIRAQMNIEGNVKAADALFDLGSMYRMLVKLGDTIPMRQEVELLRHYLNILELGHQENFYYEIDMDEAMLELDTIKLWLQPLGENYLVHGYDREREFNLFSVQGQKSSDGYRILVMDNGIGMEDAEIEALNQELRRLTGMPKEKLGIRNVCQRLRYFYQNRMTFQVKANKPRGLRIEINIKEDWNRG